MQVECQVTKITLPDCPILVSKLRTKLQEYKARNPFTAPEVDQDRFFKVEVLERLMTTGSVTKEWYKTTFADLPEDTYFTYYLDNALGIINAYYQQDFAAIQGGTGLH